MAQVPDLPGLIWLRGHDLNPQQGWRPCNGWSRPTASHQLRTLVGCLPQTCDDTSTRKQIHPRRSIDTTRPSRLFRTQNFAHSDVSSLRFSNRSPRGGRLPRPCCLLHAPTPSQQLPMRSSNASMTILLSASLARALGKHSIVLMRRHGATVVGTGLRELVFRAIYSCDNARYLSEAKRLGNFSPLTPG